MLHKGGRVSCPRCGQPVPAPGSLNFCTACGYDLREPATAVVSPAVASPPLTVLLGECPHCGASNAASRTVCGRCRSALDGASVPAPQEHAATASPPTEAPGEADSPRFLLFVTLIAGFVICLVLLTLLGARGIGFLRAPSDGAPPSGFTRLEVTGVAASSMPARAGEVHDQPANVIDGDPGTAWSGGAVRGVAGEWVELTLDRPANVARLLMWNGDQRGAQFGEKGRVRTLLIDAAGRRFSVDLLDARGSQAVDLPEPVLTAKIRLTVEAVYDGDRHPGAALSEIEVYGRLGRTSGAIRRVFALPRPARP